MRQCASHRLSHSSLLDRNAILFQQRRIHLSLLGSHCVLQSIQRALFQGLELWVQKALVGGRGLNFPAPFSLHILQVLFLLFLDARSLLYGLYPMTIDWVRTKNKVLDKRQRKISTSAISAPRSSCVSAIFLRWIANSFCSDTLLFSIRSFVSTISARRTHINYFVWLWPSIYPHLTSHIIN